jgi:hypothetical protein
LVLVWHIDGLGQNYKQKFSVGRYLPLMLTTGSIKLFFKP